MWRWRLRFKVPLNTTVYGAEPRGGDALLMLHNNKSGPLKSDKCFQNLALEHNVGLVLDTS